MRGCAVGYGLIEFEAGELEDGVAGCERCCGRGCCEEDEGEDGFGDGRHCCEGLFCFVLFCLVG